MIKILVPKATIGYYNQATNMFVDEDVPGSKEILLCLEHSLYSLSKWESKWHKSFISEEQHSDEEVIDYIKMMTVWPRDVPDDVYSRLTEDQIKKIFEYIDDPMTATTFSNANKQTGKPTKVKKVTAELLYYSMFTYGIPMECEKWHLNRLITLIHVFEVKNADPKSNKMGKRDIAAQNSALNAARRAKHHSKG